VTSSILLADPPSNETIDVFCINNMAVVDGAVGVISAAPAYSLLRRDVTSPKFLPLKRFIQCLLQKCSGNRLARRVEGKMGKSCWLWVVGGEHRLGDVGSNCIISA